MAKHLQDFNTTAQWVAKATTVAADEIAIADSAASKAPKLVPISGLAGIPAANITNTPAGNLAATTVQAALDELQTDINGLSAITGQYEGSAATFAALPTGGTVADGDWALLTADDGGNQAGIYVRAAGAWTLGTEIPEANLAVMVGATGVAAGTAGIVPAPAAGDNVRFLSGAGTYLDAPAASLQATSDVGNVTTNDLEITVATAGYILRDTGGQRYRMTIDTDGGLITTAI